MASSDKGTQEISGIYLLQKNEVAYNGDIFDCNTCNRENKCDIDSKPACKKCMCQALYTVTDKSRLNDSKVTLNNCADLDLLLTSQMCDDESYLVNNVKQVVNIVDCRQSIRITGSSNALYDSNLRNYCGGQAEPTPTESQQDMRLIYAISGTVGLLIIVNMYLLFR